MVPKALRILSCALAAALAGVVVAVAVAVLPTLFGYHAYIVYGGSMTPSLRLGSVAVAKPVSPEELRVGDVIARRWSPDSSAVLHRIVDITIDDGQYVLVTQGDQNGRPDPDPVFVEGKGDKIIYAVPYVGFLLHFARTTIGFVSLVAIPIAFLLGQTLWKMRGLVRRPLAGT
jgi:signal peptidase